MFKYAYSQLVNTCTSIRIYNLPIFEFGKKASDALKVKWTSEEENEVDAKAFQDVL